jgi:hypothetical protein
MYISISKMGGYVFFLIKPPQTEGEEEATLKKRVQGLEGYW